MDTAARTSYSSPHRPMGWFGLVLVVALLIVTFSDGRSTGHWAFAAGVLLFGAVIVTVYVRPGLHLHGDHLLVRNALSDERVPWTAVETIDVRQVLEIDVGARVVRALAFGRTVRQQRRYTKATDKTSTKARAKASADLEAADVDYTDFVVGRLRNEAQTHGGLRVGASSGEPVERRWRWPEIGVLAGLAALTLVLTLV